MKIQLIPRTGEPIRLPAATGGRWRFRKEVPAAVGVQLPISSRTVLVDLGTVRAVLGISADSLMRAVDRGMLRWVFDIGLLPGAAARQFSKRELRFWVRESYRRSSAPG